MYLFDIDGTLLLSGGAGSRVINQIFATRFGVSGVMDSVVAGGKTDEMILQECATEHIKRPLEAAEISAILDEYVPGLREEMAGSAGFRMMPFVEECMAFLAQIDSPLGIATGNVERAAKVKLDRAGLSHFFSFGGYGSDSAVRSELVEKAVERGRDHVGRPVPREQFVVVGDTLRDIDAARACGLRVIAVATGGVSKETLAAAKPDAIFDTLEELPAWHTKWFDGSKNA